MTRPRLTGSLTRGTVAGPASPRRDPRPPFPRALGGERRAASFRESLGGRGSQAAPPARPGTHLTEPARRQHRWARVSGPAPWRGPTHPGEPAVGVWSGRGRGPGAGAEIHLATWQPLRRPRDPSPRGRPPALSRRAPARLLFPGRTESGSVSSLRTLAASPPADTAARQPRAVPRRRA